MGFNRQSLHDASSSTLIIERGAAVGDLPAKDELRELTGDLGVGHADVRALVLLCEDQRVVDDQHHDHADEDADHRFDEADTALSDDGAGEGSKREVI